MSGGQAIAVYSLCWAAFGVTSGWAVNRMPASWLTTDRGPLRLRRWEARGRWYDRHLKVRRWQRLLPDAGGWFRGGVRKSEVLGFDTASLETFARETRRAEWVHWANLAFGATFALWTPPAVALVMVAFGVVAHLPFVVAQRYNRARVASILDRRRPTAAVSRPPKRRMVRVALWSFAVTGLVVAIGAIRRAPTEPVSLRAATEVFGESQERAAQRPMMPAEGVYRYTGDGTERLGGFGTTRQGPELPATVQHLSDTCWSFRIDFNTRHWQEVDFCVDDGVLSERGGRSEQRFDLIALEVGATTRTRCEPAIVHERSETRRGVPSRADCRVESSGADAPLRSAGTTELVERTTVAVGGEQRTAFRYRRWREITGEQSGSERSEWWLDGETGLPLRNERTTTLRTGSPLGELTYEERGEFHLDRLDPW